MIMSEGTWASGLLSDAFPSLSHQMVSARADGSFISRTISESAVPIRVPSPSSVAVSISPSFMQETDRSMDNAGKIYLKSFMVSKFYFRMTMYRQ